MIRLFGFCCLIVALSSPVFAQQQELLGDMPMFGDSAEHRGNAVKNIPMEKSSPPALDLPVKTDTKKQDNLDTSSFLDSIFGGKSKTKKTVKKDKPLAEIPLFSAKSKGMPSLGDRPQNPREIFDGPKVDLPSFGDEYRSEAISKTNVQSGVAKREAEKIKQTFQDTEGQSFSDIIVDKIPPIEKKNGLTPADVFDQPYTAPVAPSLPLYEPVTPSVAPKVEPPKEDDGGIMGMFGGDDKNDKNDKKKKDDGDSVFSLPSIMGGDEEQAPATTEPAIIEDTIAAPSFSGKQEAPAAVDLGLTSMPTAPLAPPVTTAPQAPLIMSVPQQGQQSVAPSSTDLVIPTNKGSKKRGRSRKINYGTNAAKFDVAGIMLRMTLEQAKEMAEKRGYQLLKEEQNIPQFLRWKYDARCRKNGVIGYSKLGLCVQDYAQEEGKNYISVLHYVKYDTKEKLNISFSSTYTQNKVYRVEYISQTDESLGISAKAQYQRYDRLRGFWLRINKKYGKPDDERLKLWCEAKGKPYLQAFEGKLVLEDPRLPKIDAMRMKKSDLFMIDHQQFSF